MLSIEGSQVDPRPSPPSSMIIAQISLFIVLNMNNNTEQNLKLQEIVLSNISDKTIF